jgi:hypothetical protein
VTIIWKISITGSLAPDKTFAEGSGAKIDAYLPERGGGAPALCEDRCTFEFIWCRSGASNPGERFDQNSSLAPPWMEKGVPILRMPPPLSVSYSESKRF